MGNGDHGRSRIITNQNIIGPQPGLTKPGASAPMLMHIAIPAEDEEKIRKTLQEFHALASGLLTKLDLATERLETLEKKRDALHLKEPT